MHAAITNNGYGLYALLTQTKYMLYWGVVLEPLNIPSDSVLVRGIQCGEYSVATSDGWKIRDE